MITSNNSPLLKDSQKTKGTIWKPLIAVSSLSIFSFISGQYLPYVIIAVSGSGTIAAVPLAIFAVSAVVALISTIYLIRLAVSRADSKKEAGLDGEEFGHIASQELVCGNCANLENKPIGEELIKQDSGSQTEVEDKSNVSTPTPPPVTLGTQPNPSPPPPPPPPPPGFFIAPKRTEQPKNGAPKKAGEPGNDNDRSALLKQIREGFKLKAINNGTTQENTSTCKKYKPPKDGKQAPVSLDDIANVKLKKPAQQGGGVKKLDAVESNKGTDKNETPEARAIGMGKDIEERKKSGDNDPDLTKVLKKALEKRATAMAPSDDEDEHESVVDDDEWSDGEKGTKTPESGYGSGSELTSPLHSVPKAGKPPIPPKPAGLQTKPEVPPVKEESSVSSEMKDPDSSALSIKERIALFGQK